MQAIAAAIGLTGTFPSTHKNLCGQLAIFRALGISLEEGFRIFSQIPACGGSGLSGLEILQEGATTWGDHLRATFEVYGWEPNDKVSSIDPREAGSDLQFLLSQDAAVIANVYCNGSGVLVPNGSVEHWVQVTEARKTTTGGRHGDLGDQLPQSGRERRDTNANGNRGASRPVLSCRSGCRKLGLRCARARSQRTRSLQPRDAATRHWHLPPPWLLCWDLDAPRYRPAQATSTANPHAVQPTEVFSTPTPSAHAASSPTPMAKFAEPKFEYRVVTPWEELPVGNVVVYEDHR